MHLIYSQPYSNVKPTFHVLYQANKNSKLISLKVNFKDKSSKIIEVEFYTSPKKYTLTIDQKYLYCKNEGEKMQKFDRKTD